MDTNGKISTILVTIALLALGFFAVNPELLQTIFGQAAIALPIGGILLAFYNYYWPRYQKMVETGEQVTLDWGKVSTFLATGLTIIGTFFAADPALLQNTVLYFMGGELFAKYGLPVLYIVTAILNYQFPRNMQNQPGPITEEDSVTGGEAI